MKISLPKRHLNRLGLAPEKREYDLPFNDDSANRFLMLLIGLMTYMALLSAAAGMVLTGMADRWTSGLSDHMTIEIPSVDTTGIHLTETQQKDRLKAIESILNAQAGVEELSVQSPQDVGKLVEPWLGAGDQVLNQIPLPTLISVTLSGDQDQIATALKDQLGKISPDIRIETHKNWLNDVLRLTGTLSFAAYLIGLITAITTISAVAGAVRARMAAYKEQLEILHLIGAADEYITRQFQKHALQLSFIGAATGFVLAMMTLTIIDTLAGTVQLSLLPSLVLSGSSFLMMVLIPLITCTITVLTTRITVLQSLQDMP